MAYRLEEVVVRTNNTNEGMKKYLKFGKILPVENFRFFLTAGIYFNKGFLQFLNIVITPVTKMEIMTSVLWA